MIVVGLLGLVLTLVLGYATLIAGTLDGSFAWTDLLAACALAVAACLLTLAVGRVLDARCRAAVAAFVAGQRTAVLADAALRRQYHWLLGTQLPLLLYLLLIAPFATLSLARFASAEGRHLVGGAALVIGLAVSLMAVSTTIGLLSAGWRLLWPPRPPLRGEWVERTAQPRLWELTAAVASELDLPPVGAILAVPSSRLGVYMDGPTPLALSGRGRRVLILGLVALHGLTVGQLRAILAHEYGHFGNRDTQWSSYVYALSHALAAATSALSRSTADDERGARVAAHEITGTVALAQAIVAFNPVRALLALFAGLWSLITPAFSRAGEVEADRQALERYGGATFAAGLRQVVANDRAWAIVIEPRYTAEALRGEPIVPRFSHLMSADYHGLTSDRLADFAEEILREPEPPSEEDTHPPLAQRLAYAARFKGTARTDTRPVTALFDDWDGLDAAVARVYHRELAKELRQITG